MATVTAFTAERSKQIEDTTVVSGEVQGDNLVLHQRNGTPINAGNVRGPKGDKGVQGDPGQAYIICTSTTRPALTPADEGKACYETDTDLTRTWNGTRWMLQEYSICTSTTRPAGLTAADEGVMIYEKDIDLLRVWTGTAWKAMPLNYVAANVSARDGILPSPMPGTICYLMDCKLSQIYDGTMWQLNGVQRMGSKTITDRAGFNNTWYDISKGGFAVAVIPKLRIRLTAVAGGYLVINSSNYVLNIRAMHDAVVIAGGQYGARHVTDLSLVSFFVEEANTITGNVNYNMGGTTNYNVADIPVNGYYSVDAVAMDP
jgi:hypothetical protein